jgi:hypothetical protein
MFTSISTRANADVTVDPASKAAATASNIIRLIRLLLRPVIVDAVFEYTTYPKKRRLTGLDAYKTPINGAGRTKVSSRCIQLRTPRCETGKTLRPLVRFRARACGLQNVDHLREAAMPDDSFPPFKGPLFKDKASDPWARTAVRAGSVEEVVSTDRRRRSRGPKLARRKQENAAVEQSPPERDEKKT